MVKKVSHKELKLLIKGYYKQKDSEGKKIPLIVLGSYGLGKSSIIKEVGQEISEKKNKVFMEWIKTTQEEKEEIIKNPEKYFVLMDFRLAEVDSSDLRGLPNFKDEKSITWLPPYWTKLLENPKSDGILFFDEMNLAMPIVLSSVYKILYDRCINESKINENWLIMGAGNLATDKAFTTELPNPLKDRGGMCELSIPDIDSFTEWGIKNGIDSKIIGFLNWKPSYLHSLVKDDNDERDCTPRGWARVSTLINGIDNWETIELMTQTAINSGIALEFVTFCRLRDTIKLNEVIKNPEILREIKGDNAIGTLYFIISSLAEQYKNSKEVTFERIMKISEVLDSMKKQELVSMCWRLCIKYNPVKFGKEFTEKDINNPIKQKYKQYILD